MQQAAANAYGQTSQQTAPPRELEATLLIKAAGKMQVIRDEWDDRKSDLDEALHYNRKLWTIFVGAASDEGSPLPLPVRQNIRNLGVFIFERTLQLQIRPEKEKITALITINREIAAGLRTNSDPEV